MLRNTSTPLFCYQGIKISRNAQKQKNYFSSCSFVSTSHTHSSIHKSIILHASKYFHSINLISRYQDFKKRTKTKTLFFLLQLYLYFSYTFINTVVNNSPCLETLPLLVSCGKLLRFQETPKHNFTRIPHWHYPYLSNTFINSGNNKSLCLKYSSSFFCVVSY